VHEQDMGRQAVDDIHGTPWLMAAADGGRDHNAAASGIYEAAPAA
jgi:hypothetical protein